MTPAEYLKIHIARIGSCHRPKPDQYLWQEMARYDQIDPERAKKFCIQSGFDPDTPTGEVFRKKYPSSVDPPRSANGCYAKHEKQA
jgi:hypothetical protein